ncbi:olfactory receptor 1020-like [Microcaecilia unicolor]|uniref:Olfactory receptor n=1 Tax=Microcaecilia unicolor TaxID=1415580 RepID=A0A6P7X1M1_9AMPH|nr:olfactory receptor 1020-like [Microcaecilia unicolor]
MAGGKNQTLVTEFILLGFSDLSKLKNYLFTLFFVMYILTVVGNIGIILLVRTDPRLHTPMYFFLGNLSFIDFFYSATITPNTLVSFLVEEKSISLAGCATQLYCIAMLATSECFLLAVMAYDRYVAICNPLLYSVLMTQRLRIQLMTSVYIGGLLHSLIQTSNVFSVSFCGPNVINHFYCDAPPILKLSCSDTFVHETVLSVFASFVTTLPLLVIVLSYCYILSAILRIRSAQGRRKAFSTCSSHVITVTLFFGTVIIMYVIPSSSFSLSKDRALSVVYAVIIPMVNPITYSLRNNDVKQALRKVIVRNLIFKVVHGLPCIP